MDDESGPLPLDAVTGLDHPRVNAYLERMDAEHPCEACGAVHWLIDHYDGKIAFTFAPLASNTGSGLMMLPMTCGNCFNMRFMNAARMTRAIIKWEKENG